MPVNNMERRITEQALRKATAKKKRRNRIIKGTLLTVVVIAALAIGVYADVSWLLVGGIEEVVRGFQANPHSAHDIAVGIVRILSAGVGTAVGSILAFMGFVTWANS